MSEKARNGFLKTFELTPEQDQYLRELLAWKRRSDALGRDRVIGGPDCGGCRLARVGKSP